MFPAPTPRCWPRSLPTAACTTTTRGRGSCSCARADLAANGVEEAAWCSRSWRRSPEAEGRADEAIQHLRAATRLADVDPDDLCLQLGKALREGDPQESARAFQRAVVLEPRSAVARLLLARQLRALGETGRAGTEAARASQLAGEDSEDRPEACRGALAGA